jgi:HAD superfamily hydrolase (TIGR01549 family)
MEKVVFWDFYNTLAYCGNLYGKVLKGVLDCYEPLNRLSDAEIKKCIPDEFTWDNPDKDYRDIVDPKKWWGYTNPIFVKAYKALGIDEEKAGIYSNEVRKYLADIKLYSLFPETIEALQVLSNQGYTQYILSNFAPELVEIITGLGIGQYFKDIIVSSLSGFEKPNPSFYKLALEKAGNPEGAWMVGDSFDSDYSGASKAGMKAVLVRNRPSKPVDFYAEDIKVAVDLIVKSDSKSKNMY